MSKYLIDANIFIQAKNLHYGFDFCPAFWDWLIKKNEDHIVFSIDKVKDELLAGKDELKDWANNNSNIFVPTTADIMSCFGTVSDWVTNQSFDDTAIHTFMQLADYYLIAHALAGNFVVVTHEIVGNSLKKIKIPNVCIGLDIPFMNPYTMLRQEKAYFTLGAKNEK